MRYEPVEKWGWVTIATWLVGCLTAAVFTGSFVYVIAAACLWYSFWEALKMEIHKQGVADALNNTFTLSNPIWARVPGALKQVEWLEANAPSAFIELGYIRRVS